MEILIIQKIVNLIRTDMTQYLKIKLSEKQFLKINFYLKFQKKSNKKFSKKYSDMFIWKIKYARKKYFCMISENCFSENEIFEN